MKPYIIVRGSNLDDLTERVEELVVEGYIPTGGPVSIGRYVTQAVYHPGVCKIMQALRGCKPPASPGFGTAFGEDRDTVPLGKIS